MPYIKTFTINDLTKNKIRVKLCEIAETTIGNMVLTPVYTESYELVMAYWLPKSQQPGAWGGTLPVSKGRPPAIFDITTLATLPQLTDQQMYKIEIDRELEVGGANIDWSFPIAAYSTKRETPRIEDLGREELGTSNDIHKWCIVGQPKLPNITIEGVADEADPLARIYTIPVSRIDLSIPEWYPGSQTRGYWYRVFGPGDTVVMQGAILIKVSKNNPDGTDTICSTKVI